VWRRLDFSRVIRNSARVAGLNPESKNLLKQTSRSFYLTLRALPGAVQSQIGLAYLLARTTDTIADTEIVPLEQRQHALQQLRARILGQNETPLDFTALAVRHGDPAERELLETCDRSLADLRGLTPEDLQRLRDVLRTIISGQELDLQRFAGASAGSIIALATDVELEDYTFRVAGCVGEFWTKMCRTHLFPTASLDETQFLRDGVRFGKGLQLVNILRDLPADLRKGRCYIPMDQLAQSGLTPTDLLQVTNHTRFGPLYRRYLDQAEAHLVAGWRYTNTIPYGQVRVRLACAWPILIGMETIRRLRSGNILDASQRIKVSRADVRRIIVQTVVRYPFGSVWRKLGTMPT
jgi:farnesyl-diphosphate farnesyltransferase